MTTELFQKRTALAELGIPADLLSDEQVRKFPTKQDWLKAANGKARARTFNAADYAEFCQAWADCYFAAQEKQPLYLTGDAGEVANSYGYVTTTARWGCWSWTDGTVRYVVDRATVSGRSVPCAYYGGKKAYARDFEKSLELAQAQQPIGSIG